MYTIVLIPNIGLAIGSLLQPYIDEFQSYMKLRQFILYLVWPIGSLLMGCILLKWGDNIASKLVKVDREIALKVEDDWEKRIFVLSLKIIGVIWLIKGIPDFIKSIGELVFRLYFYYFSIYQKFGILLGSLISIILGIYLITGGKYLVELAFRQPATKLEVQEGKKS